MLFDTLDNISLANVALLNQQQTKLLVARFLRAFGKRIGLLLADAAIARQYRGQCAVGIANSSIDQLAILEDQVGFAILAIYRKGSGLLRKADEIQDLRSAKVS